MNASNDGNYIIEQKQKLINISGGGFIAFRELLLFNYHYDCNEL